MPITMPIRAVTLSPHCAWAIVTGHKPEEHRLRRIHHRGALLIHAGCKAPDPFLADGTPVPPNLPRGVILGVAELMDCVERERGFAWIMTNPRRFVSPITCPGNLGLWVPREMTVSCARCYAAQPVDALTEPFTCQRCGRTNSAVL
ncbi:MAG: hypothetical protein K2R98_13995 [Gemmataceae bacterium]|nr:hypothetical protein [Gemmataceae bacterium]